MHRTLIDPATLVPHLSDPSWIVVDCRFDLTDPEKGEQQYREAHIPGARYAHLDRHLSGAKTGKNGRHPLPDSDVIARNFSDLGISQGTQVVAYDADNGMYASRLWWMLRWMGHDGVAVLDGGFARWQREGHPVRGGVESSTQGNFRGSPRPGWRLTVDDVTGLVGDTSRLLVKSPNQLRSQWAPILKDRDPKDVVVYCGSGVTACHNLLALEHAGIHGVKIFPGSWSEWSADPSRPVATEPE
jgi:thiosulfate/3-mercaptopyruvate sulfurtransferase